MQVTSCRSPSHDRVLIGTMSTNCLGRRSLARLLAITVAITLVRASAAWAWGSDGHKIVAYIAADNLTSAARDKIAAILNKPRRARTVARAMAVLTVLPDTDFRERDRRTQRWHFIDICLQDQRSDLAARCPRNQCVIGKINEYAERLRRADYDEWGVQGDLAFLIHFVGDLFQPLHAATNADLGGNCTKLRFPPRGNLHSLWDITLVTNLENSLDSGGPRRTASRLEEKFSQLRGQATWNTDTAAEIAWESNQIARSQIYRTLQIPPEPCRPKAQSCTNAPAQEIVIDDSYVRRESMVAGERLAKAGFTLAALLNSIWREAPSSR